MEQDRAEMPFNPYASQVFRPFAAPSAPGFNALLEDRVAALQAAREETVARAGIPSRDVKIYHNSQAPAPASRELPLTSTRKEDAALLKHAFRFAQKARAREQRFQTKAMRDYTYLKGKAGSPVHTKARVKVQFPDGMVFEANFSPLETLVEVEAEVKRSMNNPTNSAFYLFERPRHERIQSSATLADLGFVPFTKLCAAWEAEAPQVSYFKQDLVEGGRAARRAAKKSKRKGFFGLL